MAKNKFVGDNQRKGAVKTRSQIKNPITGTWTKRDDKNGKFMDVKADTKPFKGVRKSASSRSMQRTAERYSDAMKRLAKR
jgi:hypothetical protein